ncbi:cytochrome c oxidase assembly factor 3, mitochondrial [Echria macrotheca]|uniref:Cytochrome c oxidase assembly factor 3 n=1 Tax=Echria macrotheca TaxID=438768 RepID=A0AAJ0BBG7_9PEZI|nr:cytochrome c oxidase assembly factor 3, mitochondrial [Echria macrotheca]
MAGMQRDSYYRQNRHSPALIRARRPYLFRNAVLGISITAFALGIYAYTISVVGQDEFADVKVPDAPIRDNQRTSQGLKN